VTRSPCNDDLNQPGFDDIQAVAGAALGKYFLTCPVFASDQPLGQGFQFGCRQVGKQRDVVKKMHIGHCALPSWNKSLNTA